MREEVKKKSRVRVKICGITCEEDALKAAELGADALGFIFAESPRRITPQRAKAIIKFIPPWVSCIGVFVNEDINVVRRVQEYCFLDYLQFHGCEEPNYCLQFPRRGIKAFRIQDKKDLTAIADYSCPAFLLDTFIKDQPGGTGKTFDWQLAKSAKKYGRIILSGGLTPDNIRQAIRFVHPYAVDASSGLEMYPGKKDHARLSSFFEFVSSAYNEDCSSSASKA